MALMQALLKIKASVEGSGAVDALGRAIGGLSGTAGKLSGGLKGLAGAAGGLSGALGSLVPLATGAGLAAMAKGAIDAADNMNDLSQKTGVSVESLSKFQQAANASGTSIEGVGAAMIKLNRNLATRNAGATEALTALGLSATDASGKLKSTDAIMLEVADKFAKMPDGANKTAAAMALFGKAGADMIPLLNGGSKAVTDLSATMTGDFAKGADSLNDKLAALQGKLLALGVNIGTALMPALNVIADLVMNLANAFAAMPGPLQAIVGAVVALAAAFVVLAPAISAVISIAGVLAGLKIGATIAGWAAVAGPAITAISAAFTGLLTFLTGTLLPGLIAFFSGPVGWTVLAVAAVVAMAILFRKPLTDFAAWLVSWGKPIGQFFTDNVTTPISNAWTAMVEFLPKAMSSIGDKVKSIFTGVVNTVKGAMRNVLQFIANAVNSVGANVNKLIGAFNKLPGPNIPFVPILNVDKFAKGGVVNGPTLAMVGEGGESEYIIPASKMAAASANYLNGARGGAVIPSSAGGGGGGGSNAQINITTGPVTQIDNQRYATIEDLQSVARQTATQIYATLRTPAGRRAIGVA